MKADPLEIALTGYKSLRDIGNDLLIGGLIVEVFISAAIAENRRHKWLVELLAGIVVLVGVFVEVRYGGYADNIERQIRQQSNETIAALNNDTARMKIANLALAGEVVDVARLILPRRLVWTPEIDKLKAFAGTILLIQSDTDKEAAAFAESFSDLERYEGWIVGATNESETHLPTMEGVQLWYVHPKRWGPPAAMPPGLGSEPAERTAAAAGALQEYMRSSSGIDAMFSPIVPGSPGSDPRRIVMTIGKRSVESAESALKLEEVDRLLEYLRQAVK